MGGCLYPGCMHAVTIVDGELAWQHQRDPEPGRHELLVAVRAAGINGADLLQQRGLYPPPPGVPADIPGLEFAGEVIGVGPDVEQFGLGDRVMAIVAGGAQAELVVVPEAHALLIPSGIDWPAAGGFPETFSTAHDALFSQAGLSAGERLLVSGAAGGVGTAAVQLARAAGASVVASVRSPDAHDAVWQLGADKVVRPDEAAAAGPFDVLLELVGAPDVAATLPSMAPGGRIVVIGVGAGARLELNLLELMAKRVTIGGSTLRARSLADKADVARAVETHVLPLLADGRISVPVAATTSMERATEGYERFAAGGKVGKIVLVNG